jgi:hypothetical protein
LNGSIDPNLERVFTPEGLVPLDCARGRSDTASCFRRSWSSSPPSQLERSQATSITTTVTNGESCRLRNRDIHLDAPITSRSWVWVSVSERTQEGAGVPFIGRAVISVANVAAEGDGSVRVRIAGRLEDRSPCFSKDAYLDMRFSRLMREQTENRSLGASGAGEPAVSRRNRLQSNERAYDQGQR